MESGWVDFIINFRVKKLKLEGRCLRLERMLIEC